MYQVLARKYRPRNFNELVGQNHVSRALTSALERGRLHHAYLFTGTRGVGKTTIARILAKCLNCETGVTSTPCEVCPTCKAVNEGRFIDLIEIDAASRTKVEDTRELLDNVPYAPTQGRFKVYLIDEVHMLSTHSFNALLKTLEEPPEHVKFLFATTDPQKLPITVISRCLQFTLRPLAVDEITHHLQHILEKEAIAADKDAIWQIAESAQGSLRDALSLTDQAIAYGQGEVHHQDVKEMLGLIDRTIIYDLILAIHQNQQTRVSQLLLQLRQQALDVSLVLDQLISTLHELALLQYLPDLSLKYSEEINQKILSLSKMVSAQDLQLYYQIACKGRAELQLAVTQEQGFEMCVLRLLAFRPLQIDEQPEYEQPLASTKPYNEPEVAQDSLEQEQQNESFISNTPNTIDTFTTQKTQANDSQLENLQVEQETEAFTPQQNVDVNQDRVSEPEITNEPEDILVFDAQDDQLIGLAASKPVQPLSIDDMITIPVETEQTQMVSVESKITETSSTTLFVQENVQQTESVLVKPSFNDEPDVAVQLHNQNEVSLQAESNLMPQDILKLAEQELEGEWTLEKWEYWFRTSELSPAVQELAQYGLMSGTINGVCKFHIPQRYEGMLSQLQQALEDQIKARWSNTQFSVIYEEVVGTTPYNNQVERKQKAFHRAEQLLTQHPVIQSLIETFDGELQNIQLKH